MTFLELQNELIAVPAARFKETQRESVKKWINYRYATLWSAEDWTFRRSITPLTITAGVITMPTDFAAPLGLWDNNGTRLRWIPTRDFYTAHLPALTTGSPSCFTVVDDQIILDPTPSGNLTFQLHYEQKMTPLVNDTDVPGIPLEHHYLLVHGATATGSVGMNDFTYQFAEQMWTNGLDVMRRDYLEDQSEETVQWGSYMDVVNQ